MNNKNKLAFEKSEYLLQHSTNPVNWYPWSDEIFRLSKNLNKPIFLSIGYSSCHWCHVMERESFEDKFTADILNKNFISVKVDREERPDIDSLYMAAVQMISGSGGWPATLFLNENGIPFFAGTYFPPKANSHYPSFTEVLAKVTEIYSRDKDNINKHVELVYENLKKYFEQNSIQKINVHNLYDKMSDEIKNVFDYENGGFGTHPKFPEVSKLEILFKFNKRYNNDDYLDMAQLSLGSMITGGLFDQLRGGFSRYSTDRAWKIPHFEKMLYDNGLLIRLLSISYQITKNKEILINIKQNISFLLNEMKNDKNLSAPSHRLKMTYLALKNNADFQVDDLEITRKGTSYTIDTIIELKNRFDPGTDFYLIMGEDAVSQINFWKDPNYIMKMVKLAVMSRTQEKSLSSEKDKNIEFVRIKNSERFLEVSSSKIRKNVNERRPIKEFVHRDVEKYIRDNKLYGNLDEKND